MLKFLQEIGYDDIFNVDEVNEIKALYDKAQEEIKENFENEFGGGKSYKEKLEERMLAKSDKNEKKDDARGKDGEVEVIDG